MIAPELLSQLAQTCRANGIRHLKTADIELEIDLTSSGNALAPEPVPAGIANAMTPDGGNPEATEKLKGLIETLKLPDDKVMDMVFPNGAGG